MSESRSKDLRLNDEEVGKLYAFCPKETYDLLRRLVKYGAMPDPPSFDEPPSSNERVEHELKVASEFFDAVESGQKPFEIRKGDRPFKVGDTLWLREVDIVLAHTGREARKRITFVLRGWGMESGYVALGLASSPVETQPARAKDEPGPWWTPTAEVNRLMRWCKDANTITLEISTKVLEGLLYDSLLWRKDRAAQQIKPVETKPTQSRGEARWSVLTKILDESVETGELPSGLHEAFQMGGDEMAAWLDRRLPEEPSYKSQLPPTSLRLPMPPVKPPREPDLTCDGFVPDPHSSFCDKCGYPEREHRRTVKAPGDRCKHGNEAAHCGRCLDSM